MSIVIKGLSKSYPSVGKNIEVLKGLSLAVGDGEIVAILGRSGSGKSTLLSLIAGMDRADRGELEIGGESIVRLSESEMTEFRGRKIGIVFQQFHLIQTLTALENVMLPAELAGSGDAEKKAEGLLNQVGLSSRSRHFPHQLSGGECQRVGIARALASEPAIVLADEPTGNLDSETSEVVTKALFETVRAQKTTMLVVTHSEELARRCDRTLRLSYGQLQEDNDTP